MLTPAGVPAMQLLLTVGSLPGVNIQNIELIALTSPLNTMYGYCNFNMY